MLTFWATLYVVLTYSLWLKRSSVKRHIAHASWSALAHANTACVWSKYWWLMDMVYVVSLIYIHFTRSDGAITFLCTYWCFCDFMIWFSIHESAIKFLILPIKFNVSPVIFAFFVPGKIVWPEWQCDGATELTVPPGDSWHQRRWLSDRFEFDRPLLLLFTRWFPAFSPLEWRTASLIMVLGHYHICQIVYLENPLNTKCRPIHHRPIADHETWFSRTLHAKYMH